MIDDEYGLFCKFIKMKPPIFKGIEFDDAFKILVDCNEHQHKIGVI